MDLPIFWPIKLGPYLSLITHKHSSSSPIQQVSNNTTQMGSVAITEKPHVVCIPFPAQGHINPMMKVAKLLHHRGFHITFVNTEYNHKRLLKSRGPESLKGLDTFRFETIPDGLPPSENEDETQDIPSLCEASKNNCLAPFKELLKKLNDGDSSDVPPVSCIVSDAIMSFTLDAAEELGIPDVLFWTTSACGFLGYAQYRRLIDEGFTPLKDASCLTNGYLDTVIDWIPGMEKNIRLRDLPSFVRTTDPNEFMLHFPTSVTERSKRASAIILNTYDALEHDVLAALSSIYPPIYSIGPVHLLVENQAMNDETKSIGSNLWKEDLTTLNWLDDKEPNSVVYVNFGSITVMTPQQLVEFAWGLANSKETFLWIIRSDLVKGDSAILKTEFITETKNRGLLASWCPQEKVLAHPSIGGFLTHNGWNSTIESISNGVPMVCWPFFAEQQTNVFYCCTKWEIGMEINSDVKRDEVEILVRELMQGEKGKKLRKKAMELKSFAEQAVSLDGSSVSNLDKFVGTLLRNLQKKYY